MILSHETKDRFATLLRSLVDLAVEFDVPAEAVLDWVAAAFTQEQEGPDVKPARAAAMLFVAAAQAGILHGIPLERVIAGTTTIYEDAAKRAAERLS